MCVEPSIYTLGWSGAGWEGFWVQKKKKKPQWQNSCVNIYALYSIYKVLCIMFKITKIKNIPQIQQDESFIKYAVWTVVYIGTHCVGNKCSPPANINMH